MKLNDNINSLFDPDIEELCIDYVKNNCNSNYLINKLAEIQEEMDQSQIMVKTNAIKDNSYVFNKLLNNITIKEELSNFFVEKYIIIFKYRNHSTNHNKFKSNFDYDDLKFIQKIKSNETDNLDFNYYFFNFMLEKFNNFISEKKNLIFESYKNENIVYFKILEKIFEELYNVVYNNIDEEFKCPISLNIMNEAIKTKHGQNFDKKELIQWLNKNNTCPMTRLELNINEFEIDLELNNKIKEWKEKNINKKEYDKICCGKKIDIENFEEYFYKNCYNNEELEGFNYNIICSDCNKKIFNYL